MNRFLGIPAAALGLATGALGFVAAGPVGGFVGGAAGAVAGTAAMLFGRSGGWGLLLARTRIDYRREIGDPATNSIVGAVVGWISRNFPEAPVRIQIEGAAGDEDTILPGPTGPGYMLRILERPNRMWSGVLMWRATVVDYITRGNAYWLKARNASGRVVELWWVPERLMEPAWPENDPSVFISHYWYKVDGLRYRIEVEDVVHFRNGLDPATQGRTGLSALASLFREIFTDEEAANFTAALLRNLGIPGVTISPTNTVPGGLGVDPEKVKQTWMEKFTGDRRGEPFVSNFPIDIKQVAWSPQQMDLKALRRIPEERISAVLGVPAGVAQLGAGLDRNTFSNYGEANRAAYTQGVIPSQREIAAELEVQLLPEFADTDATAFDVLFDWTKAAAMQEAAEAIWRRHESAATKGLIMRSTFKRATGQKTRPEDDVYILPNNYVIVKAGGDGRAATPGLRQPSNGRSNGLAAGEVRCSNAECNRLLAEKVAPPYRFSCPKCKGVTEAGLEDVALVA